MTRTGTATSGRRLPTTRSSEYLDARGERQCEGANTPTQQHPTRTTRNSPGTAPRTPAVGARSSLALACVHMRHTTTRHPNKTACTTCAHTRRARTSRDDQLSILTYGWGATRDGQCVGQVSTEQPPHPTHDHIAPRLRHGGASCANTPEHIVPTHRPICAMCEQHARRARRNAASAHVTRALPLSTSTQMCASASHTPHNPHSSATAEGAAKSQTFDGYRLHTKIREGRRRARTIGRARVPATPYDTTNTRRDGDPSRVRRVSA